MSSVEQTITTDSLKNLRITVMGLGKFGGGAAVTRFLVQRGAIVTLTDLSSETELADSLKTLEPFHPAKLILGKHREEDFKNTDLLVVNPAVKPDNRFLKIANVAGVPRTSEMNLFWRFHQGRTIAVTGSNGKSTTASMIDAILRQAGFCSRLGGNIGQSLLEQVEEILPSDLTVLELSSFQLTDLSRLEPRPEVAVLTNFSPNHLDWHGTLSDYRTAKQSLIRWQTQSDTVVTNADDSEVSHWPTNARRIGFGEHPSSTPGVFAVAVNSPKWRVRVGEINQEIPLADWLCVPGRHNQLNAAAAIAATLTLGVTLDDAKAALQSFQGLPHRLEFVIGTAGRKFYNDSIATTPESVRMALEAFSQPLILIAGGSDKGTDLKEMATQISRRVKAVALIGETAAVVNQHLKNQQFDEASVQCCDSLTDAVSWAGNQSQPGDVILLSPGCASYDWFQNFQDRGEQFTRLAKSWRPSQ